MNNTNINITVLLLSWCFRGVRAGGHLNNGTNAGFAYFNCNNAASNRNANYGSHLILHLKNNEPCSKTLPLGKTQNNAINNVSTSSGKLYMMQENMKRKGDLFEEICSLENIKRAYLSARKKKTHYKEVKVIDKSPDKWFNELREMLLSGQFKNSEYTIIEKETGGKLRIIYKLPFYPDRIVHHCLVQVLSPLWMNLFIRDTFSTIPGRGIHDTLDRLKKGLRDKRETTYCLKFDCKKYFPSVDNDILKLLIRRKIKCKKTLVILDEIIDSTRGIPIGNYISQWLSNVYLAYFDRWIKQEEREKYYYRYADDMVILSSSKEHLHKLFLKIREYFYKNLKLTIKENYQVFPVEKRGIDFVGYRFFHDYILVRKSIVARFKRKIVNRNKVTPQDEPSYYGWFIHANTFNLLTKYFNMRKFSSFAESPKCLNGDKIRIDEVLNREIQIIDFRVLNGKYETENCLQLQVKVDDKLRVLFTGSKVLTEQVEQYKSELPFIATIIKNHKYFTFT